MFYFPFRAQNYKKKITYTRKMKKILHIPKNCSNFAADFEWRTDLTACNLGKKC